MGPWGAPDELTHQKSMWQCYLLVELLIALSSFFPILVFIPIPFSIIFLFIILIFTYSFIPHPFLEPSIVPGNARGTEESDPIPPPFAETPRRRNSQINRMHAQRGITEGAAAPKRENDHKLVGVSVCTYLEVLCKLPTCRVFHRWGPWMLGEERKHKCIYLDFLTCHQLCARKGTVLKDEMMGFQRVWSPDRRIGFWGGGRWWDFLLQGVNDPYRLKGCLQCLWLLQPLHFLPAESR